MGVQDLKPTSVQGPFEDKEPAGSESVSIARVSMLVPSRPRVSSSALIFCVITSNEGRPRDWVPSLLLKARGAARVLRRQGLGLVEDCAGCS